MNKINVTAVTVIVPVYKVPPCFFSLCLDSLHNQTLCNCEFLILLDGPDKYAESICKKYADIDFRFKIFINSHSGASATRNFGIKIASGEFITFLDADDWIDADCCKETYDFALQNDSEIVLFDYIAEGKRANAKPYDKHNLRKLSASQIEELKKQAIRVTSSKFLAASSTCCKLEKKEFLNQNSITFDITTFINEDRIVAYNIFSKATKISYLNKAFYHYNYSENSVSNKIYQNALPMVLHYLKHLKSKTNDYDDLIGTQALVLFFMHFGRSYFCTNNTDSLRNKISNICAVAKSNWFKNLTSKANTKELIPILRFESLLIRHKIMLPVWVHAIKWTLCSFFKEKFSSNL